MEEINKKIFEILETAKKNSFCNFDLMRDHSLSQTYPLGETAYFKQKIFELNQLILEKSIIGQVWIENYCNYDILETGWISKYSEIAVKHMDEKAVIEDVQWFARQFLQLVAYKNIIKENENEIRGKQSEQSTFSNPDIVIPELKDNSKLKEKANDLLSVLSGNWFNQERIMTDDEYKCVIDGIFHLIDTGKVKPIGRQISTPATMQFIRRLFRELNTELYGKGIKDSFIEFLHAYFIRFNEPNMVTTKKHFNEYRNSDFDTDYKRIMESVKK